jgi:predicted small secreted protein
LKRQFYTATGLIGLLLVLGTVAAACNSSDDAGEDYIHLGEWLVDPTCSFIADQAIVQFKGNRPTDEALGIISDHGAHRIEVSQSGVWLLKVNPDEREDLIEALAENPAVEYAERNGLGSIPEEEPCDSLTATPQHPGD